MPAILNPRLVGNRIPMQMDQKVETSTGSLGDAHLSSTPQDFGISHAFQACFISNLHLLSDWYTISGVKLEIGN